MKRKVLKPKTATATVRTPVEAYIGWAEFRNKGGELLADVAKTGKERAVGTGRSSLQMRLRPASKHPTVADKVRKEHTFRFDAAKEQIHQLRALVAMGVPFVLLSKRNSRVLADRHPAYDHKLIDKYLTHVQRAARRDAYKEILAEMKKILESSETTDQRVYLREGEVKMPEHLMRLAEDEFGSPENFVKAIRLFLFARGADAALTAATNPNVEDLDGFPED
jgi:hypothetical protein